MDAPILTKSLDSGSPISPSIAVSITSPEKENSIQNEEVTNLKESSSYNYFFLIFFNKQTNS